MAIDFIYDNASEILIVTISGQLDMAALQIAAQKLTSSNEFPSNVNTIYDMTKMDFSNITTEFEENVILFRKQLDRGDAKIACVTPTDLGFGMGRMYEVLSDKLPQQVRVFRTFEEAKDWVQY